MAGALPSNGCVGLIVTSSDIKVGVDINNVVFVFMDATINVDESEMLHWFNGMFLSMAKE